MALGKHGAMKPAGCDRDTGALSHHPFQRFVRVNRNPGDIHQRRETDSVAGVRGLEPPDVISTIFVAAARGRNVSSPTISANEREFPQLFQPFRKNDICEFESSHPSHGVRSPLAMSISKKLRRDFRGLAEYERILCTAKLLQFRHLRGISCASLCS